MVFLSTNLRYLWGSLLVQALGFVQSETRRCSVDGTSSYLKDIVDTSKR